VIGKGEGQTVLYALTSLELSQKRPSVLKNSVVPFSGPHSGAENTAFVVFWPDFQMFWSFLDYRPVRQRLFQQLDRF
jgi:hypothetical protein